MKKNIGLRVKVSRTQKKMTQAELAEKIDKAFETISNIERGKTFPNFQTLLDIANVLGVPMKEFFEDESLEGESQNRKKMILKITALSSQLNDEKLSMFLKIGEVINENNED